MESTAKVIQRLEVCEGVDAVAPEPRMVQAEGGASAILKRAERAQSILGTVRRPTWLQQRLGRGGSERQGQI